MIRKIAISVLTVLFFSTCVEPFDPPYSDSEVNFLVVDGFVNTTDNSATVKLTHAVSLASADTFIPEQNAVVSIEEEAGSSFTLLEQDAGVYSLSAIPLNPSKKYKLHIQTTDSKTYQSTFIELKQSPAIDSISWKAASDGVTLYSNAHDDTKATRYYRWEYVETYMYNSPFDSNFKRENGNIIYRTPDERIHKCWRTVTSTKIMIASSEKLSQDAILNYPLTFIPKGSEPLGMKYSILVKQRGITQDEYNFLEQLQKTTEQLGGLFDPLPSQVVGNVSSVTNSSEPVLGNFSGGSVVEKRIFIKPLDLPPDLRVLYSSTGCLAPTVLLADLPNLGDDYLIVDNIVQGGIILIGYTYTTPICADCRLLNGSSIEPDFWE